MLRRQWFPLASGMLCLFWAGLAWLTVIPNQDMLADATQAQSILEDPRIVLAFPGQKHGGTVEYPVQILAEWLAPGNYYVHTAARVVLAGLTGFVVAKLLTTLYPRAPKWVFLLGVAVGPAIIHGISGPQDNPVGNFWLVGNYCTSWLLVTTGAWILARNLGKPAPRLLVSWAAGLLVGLGFFAHPNVTLLILPMAVLVLGSYPLRWRHVVMALVGVSVGIAPAIVSYVANADITTWDPSHPPFVAASVYLNALGLTGIPNYVTVVLPYAIGLPVSQDLISGTLQSAIACAFVVVVGASAVVGVFGALSQRRSLAPAATLALAWVAAFAGIVLFATFVDPVWFYSTSLSVLLWLTIGALPTVVRWRPIGFGASLALIALGALSSVSQSWYLYSRIPDAVDEKTQYLNNLHSAADALEVAGVRYLYGSYYDVIPIGYASAQRLRAISNHYDRFPIQDVEKDQPEVVVAVRDVNDGHWGEEALLHLKSSCAPPQSRVITALGDFIVLTCPTSAIDTSVDR